MIADALHRFSCSQVSLSKVAPLAAAVVIIVVCWFFALRAK
jgi:hypothetical protein